MGFTLVERILGTHSAATEGLSRVKKLLIKNGTHLPYRLFPSSARYFSNVCSFSLGSDEINITTSSENCKPH